MLAQLGFILCKHTEQLLGRIPAGLTAVPAGCPAQAGFVVRREAPRFLVLGFGGKWELPKAMVEESGSSLCTSTC